MQETFIPQCFVSYSWDSQAHKDWVRQLANRLQLNGVSTFLDQWDVLAGMDVASYMETRIRESEFVLLVCTPDFAQKANANEGGVGYEKAIITGEIFLGTAPDKKFIPLLRTGDLANALPSYLKSKAYIDFRSGRDFEESFDELLRNIFGSPKYVRPQLGSAPRLKPLDADGNKDSRKNNRKAALSGTAKAKTQTRKTRRTSLKTEQDYKWNVFLNCPSDQEYAPMLSAIAFTVISCGFRARSAGELRDSGESRFQKIFTLISECMFGIHDISRSLDRENTLPRLNTSFELGAFMGAQRFDSNAKRDRYSLILDKDAYKYQRTLSDIAGRDVSNHDNNPEKVVGIVRDWLASASGNVDLPSNRIILREYQKFRKDLPLICKRAALTVSAITFVDLTYLIAEWLSRSRGRF